MAASSAGSTLPNILGKVNEYVSRAEKLATLSEFLGFIIDIIHGDIDHDFLCQQHSWETYRDHSCNHCRSCRLCRWRRRWWRRRRCRPIFRLK